MQPMLFLSLLIPAGYLLGSIPFGLLVGRANGIDPRTAGSKNIGATNVGRLLGKKFFFIVFALDLLKSFVPMAIASWIVHRIAPIDRDSSIYTAWLSVGAAAVLGHMFSIFIKFKGGKGVSTSAGVMLGLIPYFTLPGLLSALVFVVVLRISRYVSLASMIGAATFPILYLLIGLAMHWHPLGAQLPLLLFGILIPVMIIYRHRANIARLRAGTESRVSSRAALRNGVTPPETATHSGNDESDSSRQSAHQQEKTAPGAESAEQQPPPDGRTPGSGAPSPYAILGLPSGASADDVKAAYRRMVKMYHPDAVSHLAPEFREVAHKRMQEINAAYEILENK